MKNTFFKTMSLLTLAIAALTIGFAAADKKSDAASVKFAKSYVILESEEVQTINIKKNGYEITSLKIKSGNTSIAKVNFGGTNRFTVKGLEEGETTVKATIKAKKDGKGKTKTFKPTIDIIVLDGEVTANSNEPSTGSTTGAGQKPDDHVTPVVDPIVIPENPEDDPFNDPFFMVPPVDNSMNTASNGANGSYNNEIITEKPLTSADLAGENPQVLLAKAYANGYDPIITRA